MPSRSTMLLIATLVAPMLLGCDRSPPPLKTDTNDLSSLRGWIGCGEGKSTAELRACEILADWEDSATVIRAVEPATLFGACEDMRGGATVKKLWMVARHTDDGVRARMVTPDNSDARRHFEQLARAVDAGEDATASRKAVKSVLMHAGTSETTLPTGQVRMDGKYRYHHIAVDAANDQVRFCRLAPIAFDRVQPAGG